jgi:hypothetical protein
MAKYNNVSSFRWPELRQTELESSVSVDGGAGQGE